jgi:hypothetical protein
MAQDSLVTPPIRQSLEDVNSAQANGIAQPLTEKSWYLFFDRLAHMANRQRWIVTYGFHANRPDPAVMPDGALYVEWDRPYVMYQLQGGVWHYIGGTMWGTYSPDQRPTDLGTNDAGFDFRGTDIVRQSIWSGSAWVEPDPTTTKGDLIVRSSTEVDRLPVGANTQILTADSSQPLGVKWAPANSSGVGAVSSVFGRTGAVSAASGDYTAALVTNAVSQIGSYADPGWITSLSWPKITGAPSVSSYQTPWLSNINGATFQLQNVARVAIGTTSPLYALDVRTPGSTGSQVHIASTNTDAGGYLTSASDGALNLSGGAAFTGTAWIAKNTAASLFAAINGVLSFYADSGLTVGNVYTPTERMRITAAGNVGIGATGPTAPLQINSPATLYSDANGQFLITNSANSNQRLRMGYDTTNSAGWLQASETGVGFRSLLLNPNGGLVGVGIVPAHAFQVGIDDAAKPTTNTWTITSDIRTKRNVKQFEGGMEIIRKLQPIVSEYNGKAGTPEGGRVVSLDPAKLREVIPHAVSSVRGKLDEDGAETDILGVNTHEIIYQMLLAIKQIDLAVEQLAARIP